MTEVQKSKGSALQNYLCYPRGEYAPKFLLELKVPAREEEKGF
jgi:hypothetical protein